LVVAQHIANFGDSQILRWDEASNTPLYSVWAGTLP
jgi:hypothetical protein